MTNFNVRLTSTNAFKVQTTSGGVQVPAQFSDLSDFNASGLRDKYIIMYDAVTQKYIPVNPDTILSAASNTETSQPGLPNDFVNTLDVDLDSKIDLDGGSF